MSENRKISVSVHDVPMGTFFSAIMKAKDRITGKRYEVHNGILFCMVLFKDEKVPTVYKLTGKLGEYDP